jgi:hypothetical protein
MVSERDVRLDDGRTLRAYDSGAPDAADGFTLVWHHGSPQTGAPLGPLLAAAERRGIRLLSYGRPSYPHALARAALLPGRVTGAVSVAGPRGFHGGFRLVRGHGFRRALRAAVAGREARAIRGVRRVPREQLHAD